MQTETGNTGARYVGMTEAPMRVEDSAIWAVSKVSIMMDALTAPYVIHD